jgi:enterochelin esterase-like enzyme
LLYSHTREDGQILFFYPGDSPRTVSVTGSFCGWRTPGVALRRVSGGWAAEVGPAPEGSIAYKFLVDGRWTADPVNLTRDGDHEESNALLPRQGDRGTVLHLQFWSPALGEERKYTIYLPPSHGERGRRFPTLYLLHGLLDWERSWLDKGALATTLDQMIRQGTLRETIVVMPYENGLLYRGDTRIADYLARDLVGHIDREFATLPEQPARALDGLSTGGFTSLIVGAWRPMIFRSVGCMSGSHDDRTFSTIRACADAMRSAGQRYLISGGTEEPQLGLFRAAHRALAEAGLDPAWREAPGGHDWPLWRGLLAAHLLHHGRGLAH